MVFFKGEVFLKKTLYGPLLPVLTGRISSFETCPYEEAFTARVEKGVSNSF